MTKVARSKIRLVEALGDHQEAYFAHMISWFKKKSSKEEFDTAARKFLSANEVKLHNEFLLAILNKAQVPEEDDYYVDKDRPPEIVQLPVKKHHDLTEEEAVSVPKEQVKLRSNSLVDVDRLIATEEIHRFDTENDYLSFMCKVRDLVHWTSQLRLSLTEDPETDSAHLLVAEIETREKQFNHIVASGEQLIRENHYAQDKVKEKIESVLTERRKLHTAWQQSKLSEVVELASVVELGNDKTVFLKPGSPSLIVQLPVKKHHDLTEEEAVSVPMEVDPGFNPMPPQVGQDKNNKNKKLEGAAAGVDTAAPMAFQKGAELKTTGSLNNDSSSPNPPENSVLDAAAKSGRQGAVPNAVEWPPSLKAYVSRCFNKCVTEVDKDQVENILKGKITKAAGGNTVWSRNWDEEPLPDMLSEKITDDAYEDLGKDTGEAVTNAAEEVEAAANWLLEQTMINSEEVLPGSSSVLSDKRVPSNEGIINVPVALFEPPDASKRPMYCKQEVYRGSEELSFEEIQAARWKARELKDKKLEAAGDVAAALSRIQEKAAVLESEDTGWDIKSVQRLIRKHEGFENELVALKAQIQVLIDGTASVDNDGQQGVLLSSWENLQEKAAVRKTELLLSNDYHSFIGKASDLVTWTRQLRSSAQLLKTEHGNLKTEILTREKMFNDIVADGENMIKKNHYAQDEVKKKIEYLLTERQKLHRALQQSELAEVAEVFNHKTNLSKPEHVACPSFQNNSSFAPDSLTKCSPTYLKNSKPASLSSSATSFLKNSLSLSAVVHSNSTSTPFPKDTPASFPKNTPASFPKDTPASFPKDSPASFPKGTSKGTNGTSASTNDTSASTNDTSASTNGNTASLTNGNSASLTNGTSASFTNVTPPFLTNSIAAFKSQQGTKNAIPESSSEKIHDDKIMDQLINNDKLLNNDSDISIDLIDGLAFMSSYTIENLNKEISNESSSKKKSNTEKVHSEEHLAYQQKLDPLKEASKHENAIGRHKRKKSGPSFERCAFDLTVDANIAEKEKKFEELGIGKAKRKVKEDFESVKKVKPIKIQKNDQESRRSTRDKKPVPNYFADFVDPSWFEYDKKPRNVKPKMAKSRNVKPKMAKSSDVTSNIDSVEAQVPSNSNYKSMRPRQIRDYGTETPNDDDYIYCDYCREPKIHGCEEHPPIFGFVTNLEIGPSHAGPNSGRGVYNIDPNGIPKGVMLGPYQGKVYSAKDYQVLKKSEGESGYAWELKDSTGKVSGVIDPGPHPNPTENPMAMVNCASKEQHQNVVACQYQGNIYYRVLREIKYKEEVLVYYGDDYARDIGIDITKRNLFVGPENWKEKGAVCPHCDQVLADSVALEEHINLNQSSSFVARCKVLLREKSKGKPYVCDTCEHGFDKNRDLVRHMETHKAKLKQFVCKECGTGCSTLLALTQHMKRHLPGQEKQMGHCPMCGKFLSSQQITHHAKTKCNTVKPHKCDNCGQCFVLKGDLNKHVVSVHNRQYLYSCETCDKSYARKELLTRHIASHSDDRPFICDSCDKAFKTKHSLGQHIKKVHKKERLHICPICNDKGFEVSFLYPSQLEKHLQSDHHDEYKKDLKEKKPFSCSKCEKGFPSEDSMKIHVTKMHGND